MLHLNSPKQNINVLCSIPEHKPTLYIPLFIIKTGVFRDKLFFSYF